MSSKHKDIGRLDQKNSVNKLFENVPCQERILTFLREGHENLTFQGRFPAELN